MATKVRGRERLVQRLLDEHGTTFAQECGIRMGDAYEQLRIVAEDGG